MALHTVTQYYAPQATPPLKKPFAWSYSRLKNWRVCPHKHYMVDLSKRFPMDENEALAEGQRVHEAIAGYLKNGTPLPGTMRDYYPEVRRVVGNDPAGTQWIVEETLAIRRDFVPAADKFGKEVWLRVKLDFAKVLGHVAVAVDWKTGQIKEDQEQLALVAALLFAYYPSLMKVRTQYVWLGNHATTTLDVRREDMKDLWLALMPEIDTYEQAYINGDFPPRPSGLCKRHCQVSSCQYYGKGSY